MTKISGLSQDSAPSLTDYFPTVDAETSQTKRVVLTDLITLIQASIIPTGLVTEYGGRAAPTGYLLCYGQAVSRTTYSALKDILITSLGTFTITIASPGVATLNSHGLVDGDAVYLTTTGALPTGLSANTLYYIKSSAANTFRLAATRGGADINTSGSQSGTHTVFHAPYGIGDGSTTFNVPDFRGRTATGLDAMGGTAASRLTVAGSGVYGAAAGAGGGSETHTLDTTQMPAHTHGPPTGGDGFVHGGSGGAPASIAQTGAAFRVQTPTASTGGGLAHNNTQPSLPVSYIIKT